MALNKTLSEASDVGGSGTALIDHAPSIRLRAVGGVATTAAVDVDVAP